MQSLKEINQSKKEEVPETNKEHYLYIQNGDLYCTNCDCIGYYIYCKECCICGAKWPEGKEPTSKELEELDLIRPLKPAPLVMQLGVSHMPDTEEFKDYNRRLDYILEENTRLTLRNE